MKRVFRAVWVLAANGCLAWLMFTRLVSVGFTRGVRAPELWFEFLLEVILPIVGILLELVNWKFARWVNVGAFTVAGSFWLAGGELAAVRPLFRRPANCCLRPTDNRRANRNCLPNYER
jgi:hypothetical protein